MATTAESPRISDADLDALQREADEALANVTAPFREIHEEISQKFENITARINRVNKRFDVVSERVHSVRSGLEGVNENLAANDEKLRAVSADVAALQARVSGVLENVDRVTSRLTDLDVTSRELDNRLAATRASLEGAVERSSSAAK